ncbi:response regulator [Kitasatospora purpeofusca]|uniref:response regulator n=1 Tax=Kitasatospora purpeofusca TaxID=67352 RepID=UPI00224E403F|nr:response regulator transcription factor [Kitasatospora purpeofusca]MCX4754590.1 response regulator transcription factor [Kitasatospora purpeofusca]WSR34000.1 response regulator transcription factor [Kitasatospora purpeofusca]
MSDGGLEHGAPARIRVLIADDEPMVRAGVRAVLATDPGIEIVAETGDGREAVELLRRHRPDVAVLDIRMPGTDGITAAAEIRRVGVTTRTGAAPGIVMLTTFGEDDYILRALSGGANGFLIKSGEPEELIAGVRAVADGAAYLSPKVAARVVAHLAATRSGGPADRRAAAQRQVAGLTARERDVLTLVAGGLSNSQIARRIGVVEGTVKAHVSSVLARLGVANRAAAAVLAHEAGLVAGPAG